MKNVDYLNKRFNRNFKGYCRCGWFYKEEEILVCMWEFDKKPNNGWINKVVDENTIFEEYVWSLGEKLVTHRAFKKDQYRLIVDKEKDYKELGIYRYDYNESDADRKHVWKKVANTIEELNIIRNRRKRI